MSCQLYRISYNYGGVLCDNCVKLRKKSGRAALYHATLNPNILINMVDDTGSTDSQKIDTTIEGKFRDLN